MEQLSFFAEAPRRLAPARIVGAKAGKRCLEKAVEVSVFDPAGCARFMLGWLARHGEVSGEVLTEAAVAHGFRVHDRRAFGPVYASLSRQGKIRCVGFCMRKHGHSTAGGRIWALGMGEGA